VDLDAEVVFCIMRDEWFHNEAIDGAPGSSHVDEFVHALSDEFFGFSDIEVEADEVVFATFAE